MERTTYQPRAVAMAAVALLAAASNIGCGGPSTTQAPPQSPASPGGSPTDAGPTISATAGPTANALQVTLSAPVGAEIYYVQHAGPPDPAPGTGIRYSGPFLVSALALYEPSIAIVRAVAVENGTAGAIASREFRFDTPLDPEPHFSPAPGTYGSPQAISVTSSVPAASIRYTVDGSDPLTQGIPYEGPIVLGSTATLRAVAVLYNDVTPPRSAEYRF